MDVSLYLSSTRQTIDVINSCKIRLDAFKAANRPWPPNVKVVTNNGDFAELAMRPSAASATAGTDSAISDPFGYKDLKCALWRSCWRLTDANCSAISTTTNRFATSGIVDDPFRSAFGSSDYRNAPPAGNPMRGKYLVDLFERQLQTIAGFTYTQSFAMRIKSGIISHYSVFATRSPTGLDKMKQVMWKMDLTGGYMFSDRFAERTCFSLLNRTPDHSDKNLPRGLGVDLCRSPSSIGWVIAFTPYHLTRQDRHAQANGD